MQNECYFKKKQRLGITPCSYFDRSPPPEPPGSRGLRGRHARDAALPVDLREDPRRPALGPTDASAFASGVWLLELMANMLAKFSENFGKSAEQYFSAVFRMRIV